MVFLPVGMCMIVPFHFHPQLELGQLLADMVLDVDYVDVQILGIGLLNFIGHLYQMWPFSYHNTGTVSL